MQQSLATAANPQRIIRFLKSHRSWIMALWVGGVSLVALLPAFSLFKFVFAVEQSSLSLRLLLRGAELQSPEETKIVMVGVDDASLVPVVSEEDYDKNPDIDFLLGPWPWDRAIHGIIAEKLIQEGAQIVGFDFVLYPPNPGDQDFREIIERYPGQIVVGYDYAISENDNKETFVIERLPNEALLPDDISQLLGFVNVFEDEDGSVRRAKLGTNLRWENLPFTDDPEGRKTLKKLAERLPLELSLSARMAANLDDKYLENIDLLSTQNYINYAHSTEYFFKVSYIDLLLEDRFEQIRHNFEDAIVLIGPWSDRFKDVKVTPWGNMFGVETHAHALRSILTQSFYRESSKTVQTALILGFAALLLLGNLRLKNALSKGAWIFGLSVSYLLLAQFLFEYQRLILPFVPILWISIQGGFFLIIFDFVIDQFERKQLRGYLNRYVSPEVARILVEDRDGFDQLLKGTSRPIAALFSDIRGFTAISEQYSPVGLVNHLNEYFQSMVDSILNRRGSLNKYIGDAIFAVWGDVYSAGPEKDCEGAVGAALDMVQRLKTLNAEWAQRDNRIPLEIGIGISHGEGFVGNMGHPNRMEVAVMGDVVNLGSRLEGATKQYGCEIIVGEAVRELTRDKFVYQELDIIQVKGKTQGVRIFRPLSTQDIEAPSWLKEWTEALGLYRSKAFEKALEKFEKLSKDYLEIQISSSIYSARCRELILSPPPDNWNYVFKMTTK